MSAPDVWQTEKRVRDLAATYARAAEQPDAGDLEILRATLAVKILLSAEDADRGHPPVHVRQQVWTAALQEIEWIEHARSVTVH